MVKLYEVLKGAKRAGIAGHVRPDGTVPAPVWRSTSISGCIFQKLQWMCI